MSTRFHRQLTTMVSVLALAAGAGFVSQVHAQDSAQDSAPAAAAPEDDTTVIVVVGTPGGKGINKLKASYAVTNITANDLLQANPKASSEVLTLVPGIWVESSGGVGGANIFVRGFPGTGDAQFVTFQLNGTPIYPATSLSFLDNSVMFRTDETIARVEALRGGPSPIFASGQPGLTTNFVLKEGGDTTKGDADTYGLVGDGSAITAGSLATQIGGPVKTADGTTLGSGDYVQNWGAWVVQKQLKSLVNDLSVSKTLGTHDLTFGYYASSVSADDFWTIGNFKPMQVKANGNYLAAGITCSQLAAAHSGSGCWGYGIRSAGDMRSDALYIADAWQATEKLRIDLGARSEQVKTSYVLDSGPGYPDGTTDLVVDDTRSKSSYTAGVNYQINRSMGVFGRTSTGFMYPQFDDYRSGLTDTSEIKQYELGYKLSTQYVDLFATAFYNKFDGAKFHDVGGALESNSNEAKGIELDGRLKTDFGLSVALNGTWQSTKITKSSDPANVGNSAQRQPDWEVRVTPRYETHLGSIPTTFYGTVFAVGDRFADNSNATVLKAYNKVDAGIIFDLGTINVQISGDNLGNSHGYTEGDPRSTTGANARPIFGRSYMVSVGYNF